jgi:hypothetical protein
MGTSMNAKDENLKNNKFVEQGIISYRAAMIALGAFRRVIHQQCEDVLRSHIPSLTQGLGISLNGIPIEWDEQPCGRDNAKWDNWDGTWIYIQVHMNLKNVSKDLDHLAVGLMWGDENGLEHVWPYTCFVFKTTSKPKAFYEKCCYGDLDDTEPYCLTLYDDPVKAETGWTSPNLVDTVLD